MGVEKHPCEFHENHPNEEQPYCGCYWTIPRELLLKDIQDETNRLLEQYDIKPF